MFKNVGGKLKSLAKVLCWIGIILSVISGALSMYAGYVNVNGTTVNGVVYGVIVIIVGSLGAWIGSWVLYAFGQITEDVHELRNAGTKTSD